jgi:hypothetical protein
VVPCAAKTAATSRQDAAAWGSQAAQTVLKPSQLGRGLLHQDGALGGRSTAGPVRGSPRNPESLLEEPAGREEIQNFPLLPIAQQLDLGHGRLRLRTAKDSGGSKGTEARGRSRGGVAGAATPKGATW